MNVLGKLSKFGAALALSTCAMAFPAIAQQIEDPSARNSSNSGQQFRGNRDAALRGGPNSGNRAAPAERSRGDRGDRGNRGDRAQGQRGDRGRNNNNADRGGATIQPVSATDDRGRRGNRGNQARGNRGARRGNQARGNNRSNFRGNRANSRGNFRGNRGNNVRRGNNSRRAFNRGFNQGRRNNFRRNNFRRNNFGFYNRGYIAPIYRAPIYHNAPVYVAPVYAVGGFYGVHESTIIINDYGGYGLYAPPRGYHWVCDKGSSDAILAAVATGAIIAVAADILSTPY